MSNKQNDIYKGYYHESRQDQLYSALTETRNEPVVSLEEISEIIKKALSYEELEALKKFL